MCAERLVIKVLTWDDADHLRVVKILATLAVPFSDFDNESRRARDVASSQLFLVKCIARGGFMKHVESFLKIVSDRGALVQCGFVLPASEEDMHLDNDQLWTEQEMATYVGPRLSD